MPDGNVIPDLLVSIAGGAVSAVVVGLWIKRQIKAKHEKIHEENREELLKIMINETYAPYRSMKSMFRLLSANKDFKPSEKFVGELPETGYTAIQIRKKEILERAEALPSFYECANLLTLEEYAAIKRFVLSCDICYNIYGSGAAGDSLVGYMPKDLMRATLYAKDFIRLFEKYLPEEFTAEWMAIIKNEGWEHRDSIITEPGDILPRYVFVREILDQGYRQDVYRLSRLEERRRGG